jgi:hypothetical protein
LLALAQTYHGRPKPGPTPTEIHGSDPRPS